MIHQYKLNGYNIVIDVASGSVHVVDEVAYDMIAMFQNHSLSDITAAMMEKYGHMDDVNESEIGLCYGDIQSLVDAEKLFSDEAYAHVAVDFKSKNQVVKALCLHVAHTCNLACSYCFASQGKYHGKDALMSLEVGKKALDFLIANSGTRRNLEVDFFGGEPLMNWDMVKDVVRYGRELEKLHNKHFRFTLTTNGVLIDDEVIAFANAEMDNVVLSLDGRKEVHDHFRVDYAGNGSYEKILPKFKKLVDSRGNKGYYMRGTFTHNNPDFTQDLFHMTDLGFTELSMEPVVCAEGDPYALTKDDQEIVMKQYELLAMEMLKRKKEGRPFSFYHYMLDLSHGPCIYKRVSGCGSGSEYFAVTPTGDLYPCHQFVGHPEYLMGNVDEGVKAFDKQAEFKSCNVYSRKECGDCWARLYCSGGCAANSYHATGTINGIYEAGCDLFRKRIECALMMQVAEQQG
ncbi:thioether cross-link-forming SCIFF peptide maturase [Bengtsoniella intestinalis]|uniref:thioether cross-link-forming SCIFF peptide maturase n=1 Tax=Bengtsoniella intestinalis TaxID=3073143 RepID=UPI00391F9CF3